MGVWIETGGMDGYLCIEWSHPAWVCGLKPTTGGDYNKDFVTPCVGVWIETDNLHNIDYWLSHPAWVCGLKLIYKLKSPLSYGHTLRGCVD